MSVELLPVGVTCNAQCSYCYEDPQRAAGNHTAGYDLEAMKRGLEAEGGAFTLFGGEPLLMPIADLEEILRWGFARFGHTGVQTNGMLITPAHLALFTRYHTHVGISVDGPGALNDARWVRTLEETRAATTATFAAIDALCALGRPPSLIITLSRMNATPAQLPELLRWLEQLDRQGITAVRLHPLEVDSATVRDTLALTEDEAVGAYLTLMNAQDAFRHLTFDVFTDMAQLLVKGLEASTSCIWNACDPLTTQAVRGVNGLGGQVNCSRTNKDGVDWVKAEGYGAERYLTLHETPQADGGCQDCRFFFACKGNCPGTAIDGDWRNRSEQCGLWFRTFEAIERRLVHLGVAPVSLDADRRQAAEATLLGAWARGDGGGRSHGDHWDAPDGFEHADGAMTVHGDLGTTVTHGDSPHGDGHGDSLAEVARA